MPIGNIVEQLDSAYNVLTYSYNDHFVYKINANNIIKREFVHNSEGYIRYGNDGVNFYPYYYIKDYLGNVRETYVCLTQTSSQCIQRMQYYPSGMPWNDNYQAAQQPYKYGGKEFVEMHGLDEYDSQARWYYPALMRTTTQDPLAEKYYDISPYAWCANNPVNLVDPDGMSPIYNRMGYLIGTDEYGLMGDAFIMDEKFFTQGMSFSEASFFNLGIDGLENDQALKKYNESFKNLSTRPDYDGFITDLEARNWWKEGNGAPLYVDVSQIDLSPLTIANFTHNNEIVHNFFFDSKSVVDTRNVYGNLTLTLLNKETGEIKIGPKDKSHIDEYDFNINGTFFSDFARNSATLLIRVFIVGKGTPFLFYPYGKNPIISK